MDHLEYMFAGFAVFWAALFVYILWLQARLRSVSRELERLEERLAESDRHENAVGLTTNVSRAADATTSVSAAGGAAPSAPQRTTE